MAIFTETIQFSTNGNADVIDLTPEVNARLEKLGLRDGCVIVCATGSTGAVTTCEYEPGLVQDIPEIFDQLIPPGDYHHNQTWGDGNGHAHLRASLVGPSVTIPFKNRKLRLGTWQQIVFIDFDTRNREREVTAQFIGEQ